MSSQTIDNITHLNAMRVFGYQPFSSLGRENCTVGALRAKARHVDTRPVSQAGLDPRRFTGSRKVVTSADVARLSGELFRDDLLRLAVVAPARSLRGLDGHLRLAA